MKFKANKTGKLKFTKKTLEVLRGSKDKDYVKLVEAYDKNEKVEVMTFPQPAVSKANVIANIKTKTGFEGAVYLNQLIELEDI